MIEHLKRWLGSRSARPEPDRALVANSGWFDADWYRSQAQSAGLAVASNDAVRHYLREGGRLGLSPCPDFDGVWYLSAYPDVANAKLNPLVHFLKHGQQEGRLPRRNRALARDFHLWRGGGSVMAARLRRLSVAEDATEEERHHARWALARWSAWQGYPAAAVECLLIEETLIAWPKSPAPALLALECLHRVGAGRNRLEIPLRVLERHWPQSANTALAQANVAAWSDEPLEKRLAWINAPWQRRGLATIDIPSGESACLDHIVSGQTARALCASGSSGSSSSIGSSRSFGSSGSEHQPLVSVIVPVFNAVETVATAIQSLFAQTWRRLEIIVVDDASTDETTEVLVRLRDLCPADLSFQIIECPENGGAYVVRNVGLAAATGSLITTHDSDDWSHPDKIALQVEAMGASEKSIASISFWSRVTPILAFHRWRLEDEGWVHRNVSSLMFRREVFERLGFWDEVRVNADSEYLARIEAAYGVSSILEVEPGLPLAFGRASELSLSQHGDTHLSSQFEGVRARYMAAARRWHERAKAVDDFYLAAGAGARPFPAPPEFLRGAVETGIEDDRDAIAASGYFDGGWYIRRYAELQDTRVEAFDHYWNEGRFRGYDPGPNFSQSGYALQSGTDAAPERALLHFLQAGKAVGLDPLPVIEGQRDGQPGAKTVLLCGHQAGLELYGAERSLIDVAGGLDELGYRVVVVLPAAVNASYLETLRQRCCTIAVLPYGWWQKGRTSEIATVAHFERLIDRFSVDVVSLNSIVLDEPIVAAKRRGLPVAIHLRELPREDSALCDTLNGEAEWIIDALQERADLLIANSHFTAAEFDAGEAWPTRREISVVPNTIEMSPLLALPMPSLPEGAELAIGILSSGHANKGLNDLESLLELLEQRHLPVRLVVFGPVSPTLLALSERWTECDYATLELAGYVAAPAEALARVHVVLSLARFQESFGRTALEAMAAGRPFVGYHRGALPEVVGEEAGVLVPFGNLEAVADALAGLIESPARIEEMGQHGRRRAVSQFGWKSFVASLEEAYSEVSRQPGA